MPVLTFATGYSVISCGQKPYPQIISETLSSDNLVWSDPFIAQDVSISAQHKKALVWVGCTHFAGLVGVRLGAYSDNALH